MIDHTYDFDDQYFRMITVGLAKTLTRSIRWINYFEPLNDNETGRKRVTLPFYTSMTGDERFILDAFVDDIVDKRVTMNTDQYQRGVITFNSFTSRSDEFANPNQYLSQKASINGVTRKVISKVKAVPLQMSFEIEIHLATANEIDKCSQKIMNLLFNYMFFNIDYFGIKLDAVLKLPDDKTVEIVREITMDSDRKKSIKFSLDVQSFYPIFNIDVDDLITCDNDDEIDWDQLGVPQPTNEFVESLKAYNYTFGQKNRAGGPSGSTVVEGMTEIRRSYWDRYYHEINRYETINADRDVDYNPRGWNLEDFDQNPIPPDQVNNNNDI